MNDICPEPGPHTRRGLTVLGEPATVEVTRKAFSIRAAQGQPATYVCLLDHEWPVKPSDTDPIGTLIRRQR